MDLQRNDGVEKVTERLKDERGEVGGTRDDRGNVGKKISVQCRRK